MVKSVIESRFHHHGYDSFKLVPGNCLKPVNCDFRLGSCDYDLRNDVLRGFGRVATPDSLETNFTPPEGGPYVYTDFTEGAAPGNKHLTSQLVNGGEYCLVLEYFNLGPIESISIKSINRKLRNETRPVINHHKELNKMDLVNRRWSSKRITITNREKFRLSIEISGLRRRTFFAIKSIPLEEGPCDHDVTTLDYETTINNEDLEVDFHCYQSGDYIAQYKVCDGVYDCPMFEDEGAICGEHMNCTLAGIPCKHRGKYICLNNVEMFCDGFRDCEDGIDEDPRLCVQEQFCFGERGHYCLNDAISCSVDKSRFGCECRTGFTGKRCQLIALL